MTARISSGAINGRQLARCVAPGGRRARIFNPAVNTNPPKTPDQDLSQLPAAEKQDLLARLLRRLAHEIRNPLSSLDVHFQLLEEDLSKLAPPVRAQIAPRLGIINGELHRLDTIVERFLKLAGPSALELAPVDASQMINHVCDLLRPEAAKRRVEIQANVQPGMPPIQADSVRLTQLLLNLVINAIQAVNQEGRVTVYAEKFGDMLLLTVQDTGPGIPPEKLGDIFDPYFTTKPEGSGLGLWIAEQIAVAHGGDICAENAPGTGAIFTLTLPYTR
jgi:signal transduction histidine kinase